QPASFTPLADGRSLLLGRDAAANDREIAAFSKNDVAGFRAYQAEADRLGAAVFASMTDDDPRFDRLPQPVREACLGSAVDIAQRFVETPAIAAAIATDGII